MAEHPDHYALVVGIDDYPQFRSLQGAKEDARQFAAWLRDTDTGGGLPEQNVKLLLSEPDPARRSRMRSGDPHSPHRGRIARLGPLANTEPLVALLRKR